MKEKIFIAALGLITGLVLGLLLMARCCREEGRVISKPVVSEKHDTTITVSKDTLDLKGKGRVTFGQFTIHNSQLKIKEKSGSVSVKSMASNPEVHVTPGGDSSSSINYELRITNYELQKKLPVNIFGINGVEEDSLTAEEIREYVVTKPFVSELDTIIKNDTLKLAYEFPANYLSVLIRPEPDTSRVIRSNTTITLTAERAWYDNPWTGGVIGALIVLMIVIVAK